MDRTDRVLTQLKEDYAPDEGAEQRVRQKIAASLALSAAGVGALATQTTGSGSGGLTAATATKAAGVWGVAAPAFKVLTTASVLGGLGWVGAHFGAPESSTAPASSNLATALEPRPAERLETPQAPPRSQSAPPSGASETRAAGANLPLRAPPSVLSAPSTRAPTRGEGPESVAVAPGTSLEELRLLREASRALRAGELGEAESLLGTHRRRYPNSVLSQERTGLSLLVRCAHGSSPSLRAQAQQFVATSPALPVSDPIKRQCLE